MGAGSRVHWNLSKVIETEGLILRSIRYGEADRILHIYTPDEGRMGAIAKGARKTKSRFGARLEPFTRARFTLRVGRGDLHSISGVETISPNGGLRDSADSLDWAARACDAVARLLDGPDPHPHAYNLLVNSLDSVSNSRALATKAIQVSYRLKLLVAAGLQPHLSSCAVCGDEDLISGFSGEAGGVVCPSCSAASFPLGAEALQWMVDALGHPLVDTPKVGEIALRQADRAVSETVEFHANIRLRPASAR